MKRVKTIFALEQALALPYATQRFAQLGWRVIRIETPPEDGQLNAGDPNRYIGADLGFHDLHSYYIAPNTGKEAITINLKKEEGRKLLRTLMKKLGADVFMCNTLPKRYTQLGIDYKTLSKEIPDLIWCGISAMGPEYPDRAGYDPALQAQFGFTYLTGEPEGKPVPCGIPVIDLKAGDEAFAQVLLAFLERNENGGQGKEIHISMGQCAASWLITALPQLEFVKDSSELFKRSGNEHRSFIPCNVYPTKDGFVYLAIGNDLQWAKFASYPAFSSLAADDRKTNSGRMKVKETLYKEIGEITAAYTTKEFTAICISLNLSVAPVNSVSDVASLENISSVMMKTKLPDGRTVKLAPPSSETEFLIKNNYTLSTSPRLGQHTIEILTEAGFTGKETEDMRQQNLF